MPQVNFMKENPLVLTFDFGTQSVRTALIDRKGNILAIAKKHYEPVYFSVEKGYAEQDPDVYWEFAKQSLKELADNNKELLNDIIGASLTTFRDSSVQLDKNNKPIRPCILWLDQRMAQAKEKLPFFSKLAFALVGMTNTIELNRRRTVAHWLKENEPDIWSKTKKYVNISTYLVYKLTGVLADSPSSLTGHYPLDF
jgi:sugar (pentulose or hexulose) kinase